MSHSSETTPLDVVNAATLQILRQALAENGTRTPGDGGPVHLAIREVVREARATGIPVEQVIIHLKREWQALGLASPRSPRADGAAVVERLVSLCLDEYYARE